MFPINVRQYLLHKSDHSWVTYFRCEIEFQPGPEQARYFSRVSSLTENIAGAIALWMHLNRWALPCCEESVLTAGFTN